MKISGGFAGVIVATFSVLSGPAAGQELPRSQTDYYKTGEIFAQCSAHYGFAAAVARQEGLSANAEMFEGVERGWRATGQMLLVMGMDDARKPEAVQLFKVMQDIKLGEIRGWREVDPEGYAQRSVSEFQAVCEPWSELQKALIVEMRSSSVMK